MTRSPKCKLQSEMEFFLVIGRDREGAAIQNRRDLDGLKSRSEIKAKKTHLPLLHTCHSGADDAGHMQIQPQLQSLL